MTDSFIGKYPLLFHVTRRSALNGIRQSGLQSSCMLAPSWGNGDVINANRDCWTEHLDPNGHPVWLRWQRMRDRVLLTRLPSTIDPSQWRRFINGMVFLFPSRSAAEQLRSAPVDSGVDQVILSFETLLLVRAGCDLRVCRWNNGYPDRSRPPRRRAFSDYRPITEWKRGDKVQEVIITDRIPTSVTFEVVGEFT